MSAGTELDESRPEGAVVDGDVAAEAGTDAATADGDAPRQRWRPPAGWWRRADDWMALVILVACCAIVFLKLQPHLIFRNTTPNGGDLGAHVWWPAYLRDHLLPWRLAGWTPDFYAGFPAGQFYFPVPALGIVGLDTLIPYNIAFKVVVSLGPVLVPIGAYVFARGIKAPNPTPAACAIAVTSFLFFTGDPGSSTAAQAIAFNQRIMGGNLASTLAGEFSFTLAIAFAFFFFGSLAWALRTRQHLWLPAAFLALCLMSHLMVGIFAGIGALAVWAFHEPIRNFTRAAAIGVVGVFLSAVWLLPLVSTMKYTTDMRYAPIGVNAPEGQGYTAYLFPRYFFAPQGWAPYEWGGFVLIAAAIVGAVVCLRRSTLIVLVMTALAGLAFRFWTELGTHVWNLRLVSFWYYGVFLLMAIGVAELIRGGGWLSGRIAHVVGLYRADRAAERAEMLDSVDGYGTYDEYGPVPAAVAASGNGAGDAGEWVADGDWAAPPPSVAVAGTGAGASGGWWRRKPTETGPVERRTAFIASLVLTALLAVGALSAIEDNAAKGFLPYWAKWNFSGYENVVDEISGTYTQPCSAGGTPVSTLPVDNEGDEPLCVYENRVAIGKQWPEYEALIDELKQLPPGRSLWEGGPSLDKYGTPLALMLIPYWTDGKITTMEGVYFEASATTPYHFEAVAALVAPGQNSNPVRGIPYRTQDSFDIGVRYLQALGVNYFLAHTPTTKAKADADPRLTEIASSPDVDGADPQGWSIYRVADAPLVQGLAYEPVIAEGVAPDPDGWEQQIAVPWWWSPKQLDKPVVASGPDGWKRADGAAALTTKRRAIADPAQVSHVKATDDSISFRVDEVGKPVLVKASWFPNWEVEGAEGPYRATPNFMVVVPTEKEVTLRYGTTPAEWAGRLLTFMGFVGLGLLVWWGRRNRKQTRAAAGAEGTIPARRAPDRAPIGPRPLPLPPPEPPTRDRAMTAAPLPETLDAIFKAYDIRGIYPAQIDETIARLVGNAFVAFTGAPTVLVGRDARPSSEPLVEAFTEGVLLAGADVVDLGLASTDLVYFAAGSLDAPAAMFTASHNPAEYNGIKLCRAGAAPVGEESGLRQLKAMVAEGLLERAEEPGRHERRDLLGPFVNHVRSFVDVAALAPLRVVADTANGVGGLIVPAVFSGLPMDLSMLFPELDGTFPNHPANPIDVENLRDLQREVTAVGADLGLAFDGDADRVFLVDDRANPVSGSTTTAILAKAMLARTPGGTVVHNLICSRTVPEIVRENGGTPVRTRVGHSFIKGVMAETDAIFGGEHSAHYYFRDNWRADSGIIAAMIVLEQLSKAGIPLSEFRVPFERYADSGEVNRRVADPHAVIDEVAAAFPDARQDRLDGLTVEYDDWWFNLRPSNTEPLLRLNVEAADPAMCEECTGRVLDLIGGEAD